MSAAQKPPMVAGDHVVRAKQELAAGDHTAAQTHALIAIAEALVAQPAADAAPRVSLDENGTLDDFCATNVRMVHFEAIDNAAWYATIELANGDVWQLNFGSQALSGYARAERVA